MCDLKDLKIENDYLDYRKWKQDQRNKKIDETIKFLEKMKLVM